MSEQISNNTSANNKRIAKNTLALYFRTFITMIVGLYTGRVMLQALGVDNYGINSVVGGIVAMSSLITGTMSQAISRYLTVALGKGDKKQLKTMFSTSVNAQIVMSVIVVIVLEIVGVWFLNTEANIPEGRMEAANWVLQCSIVSLVIGLISSPYNAIIVAHERMNIYAYTSIVEAILKLGICFVIMAYGGDRLILLALLQVAVGLGMRLFYGWYCGRNFEEATYNPNVFDKGLMKEITVFSGWNMFGNTSWILNTQGVNMLINVFFGVTFNAAQGIANTINHCIDSFVTNFTVAFNPQITKMFASGDYDSCYRLVNRGSRFTWMLMMLFIVPVFIEADTLLSLWLVEVPDMASVFLRFALFNSLALKFSQPLFTLIHAHGNIKRYTIEASIGGFLIFPLTWIMYQCGYPVWCTYPIAIFVRFAIVAIRLNHLRRNTSYQWRIFIKETFLPCVVMIFLSFSLPLICAYCWEETTFRFFVLVPISVIWTGVICYVIGLTKGEKKMIVEQIGKRIHRL